MPYHKICTINELPERTLNRFQVGNMQILVTKISGKIFCCENRCPHMDFPLHDGTLEGTTLTCRHHNAQFEISNGKNLCPPAYEPLTKIKVHVEGEEVFIFLQEGDEEWEEY